MNFEFEKSCDGQIPKVNKSKHYESLKIIKKNYKIFIQNDDFALLVQRVYSANVIRSELNNY